jgi:hypothetical protein
MNERTLAPEQIEILFAFCQNHGVSEYEIQEELVDHLATAIENEKALNPGNSNYDALLKAYHEFGPEGFRTVVKTKRRMFRRKYNRLFFEFVLSFFKLPRIVLTLLLTLIFFFSFHIFNSQILLIFLGALTIMFTIWCLLFKPGLYPINLEEGKKFLLVNYYNSLISLVLLFVTQFQLALLFAAAKLTVVGKWQYELGFSFVIVFLFIVEWSLRFYMPKLVKQHFMENYSQFAKA